MQTDILFVLKKLAVLCLDVQPRVFRQHHEVIRPHPWARLDESFVSRGRSLRSTPLLIRRGHVRIKRKVTRMFTPIINFSTVVSNGSREQNESHVFDEGVEKEHIWFCRQTFRQPRLVVLIPPPRLALVLLTLLNGFGAFRESHLARNRR